MKRLLCLSFISHLVSFVNCDGLLLLYRPRDVSNDCAYSNRLRYDISFGMGMSDTITLVFRTLSEVDYECRIEIITDKRMVIVVVVKYPNQIGVNCEANRDAFIVLKKDKCLYLCDTIGERDIYSPYFVFVVESKVRIRFLSNSSINSDINAHMYQLTATSARRMPDEGCNLKNESVCSIDDQYFCFTSGVVCDGIVNCGVIDWFDERKSDCGLMVERLGLGPLVAVSAAIMCAMLAAGRILLRCLPPLANSFFIFNANEDNRLCIDPMFEMPGPERDNIENPKKQSLIPISSSSSEVDEENKGDEVPKPADVEGQDRRSKSPSHRKNTMRSMAKRFQSKFRKSSGK